MQFGDGSTSRDYTYISDIVDGVVRSLDRPAGYQIYNLGNGSPVSLSSFIKLVERSVGTPAKIRVCPEQPGDVPRTCANVDKARGMLGYNPRVPFADGIRNTVKWYQERASRNDALAGLADNPSSLCSTQRMERSRSLSVDLADKDFFAHGGGGGGGRPRSMSKPCPDVVGRTTRTLSHVDEGSCAAY